jgi:hypothetical protein
MLHSLLQFSPEEMTKTTLTSDELDALITLVESFSLLDLSDIQCRTLLNKLIDMEKEVSND